MGEGYWENTSQAKYTHVERLGDGRTPLVEIADKKPTLMTENIVKDFIGKSVSMPAGWARSEQNLGGHRSITTFTAPDGSATVSLFDRGMNLRSQSAKSFADLLAANTALQGPKVLMPQEIRALADVMGVSNVGDNQYVNSRSYPDPQAPSFHLSSAQLLPVNGKVVLEVEGNFVDERGKPQKQYRGIFADAGADGSHVRELFLQADDLVGFGKNKKIYSDAVKSIQW